MSDIKTVLDETPFQTAGPFLHIGCLPNAINIEGIFDTDLGVKPFANKDYGKFITITGSVFDGDGKALDLDGIDDYVYFSDINIANTSSDEFTLCGWWNWDTYGQGGTLLFSNRQHKIDTFLTPETTKTSTYH